MTFLEELQSHRGGILRIKGQLYWYCGRGLDGSPGRICLVLDAALTGAHAAFAHGAPRSPAGLAVLLLIDGCPQWVWIGPEDVELIT